MDDKNHVRYFISYLCIWVHFASCATVSTVNSVLCSAAECHEECDVNSLGIVKYASNKLLDAFFLVLGKFFGSIYWDKILCSYSILLGRSWVGAG